MFVAVETAPSKVGRLSSNLYNVRNRYELTPYYYSLAYRAWLYAEPIVPPLVYYYQTDKNVHAMGHEKLIGQDILVGLSATEKQNKRDMYLPKGRWVMVRFVCICSLVAQLLC